MLKMKQTLLFLIGTLIISCSEKVNQARHISGYDIVTVNDNGISFSDSLVLKVGENGIVVPISITPANNKVGLNADTESSSKPIANAATSRPVSLGCILTKSAQGYIFNLNYSSHSQKFPFQIAIKNALGGDKIVGVYKAKSLSPRSDNKDTAELGSPVSGSLFFDYLQGTTKYRVDSVEVNITEAAGTQIAGNFKFWVNSNNTNKTVTGLFNWEDAVLF
jgi:hypothetical protein